MSSTCACSQPCPSHVQTQSLSLWSLSLPLSGLSVKTRVAPGPPRLPGLCSWSHAFQGAGRRLRTGVMAGPCVYHRCGLVRPAETLCVCIPGAPACPRSAAAPTSFCFCRSAWYFGWQQYLFCPGSSLGINFSQQFQFDSYSSFS